MQSNPQKRKRKQKEKNTLTGKKKKNILDTHRPSHGRTQPLGPYISHYRIGDSAVRNDSF